MPANTMMFSATAFAVTACAGLAFVGGYLALASHSRQAGLVREWQAGASAPADIAAGRALQDLTAGFARPSVDDMANARPAARQAVVAQGGLAAFAPSTTQSLAPAGPQISRPAGAPATASVRLLDLAEAAGD